MRVIFTEFTLNFVFCTSEVEILCVPCDPRLFHLIFRVEICLSGGFLCFCGVFVEGRLIFGLPVKTPLKIHITTVTRNFFTANQGCFWG